MSLHVLYYIISLFIGFALFGLCFWRMCYFMVFTEDKGYKYTYRLTLELIGGEKIEVLLYSDYPGHNAETLQYDPSFRKEKGMVTFQVGEKKYRISQDKIISCEMTRLN